MLRYIVGELCCLALNIVAAIIPLATGGPGWSCTITGMCLGITLVLCVQTVDRCIEWRKRHERENGR